MFYPIRNLVLLIFFAALIAPLFSCKNDPEESETTEEAPRTRDRKGPRVSFDVMDQSGEPIPAYRVFESFEDGASGTVFQFQHGFASIPFETKARYRIQADGYHPLDFEFSEIQSIKRMTFYMNHTGNQKDQFILLGKTTKRDMRPFEKVTVVTFGDRTSETINGGEYLIPEIAESPEEPTQVAYSWKDEAGKDGKVVFLFRGLTKDTLRIDLQMDADIPESEKDYPLN